MLKFIRDVIQAYKDAKLLRYQALADAQGFWIEEDQTRILQFLSSSTGEKFKVRLMNFAIRAAFDATKMHSSEQQKHCGIALGILKTAKFIEAHTGVKGGDFRQAQAVNMGQFEEMVEKERDDADQDFAML